MPTNPRMPNLAKGVINCVGDFTFVVLFEMDVKLEPVMAPKHL
jgi:hypothetical protein